MFWDLPKILLFLYLKLIINFFVWNQFALSNFIITLESLFFRKSLSLTTKFFSQKKFVNTEMELKLAYSTMDYSV